MTEDEIEKAFRRGYRSGFSAALHAVYEEKQIPERYFRFHQVALHRWAMFAPVGELPPRYQGQKRRTE